MNARAGFWREDVAGPNGIGAALEWRRPMLVFGPEHLCENWQRWIRFGAPVHSPVSGELLGVVDVSGFADRARQNHLPRVGSLARSIGYLLGESRPYARRCLTDV